MADKQPCDAIQAPGLQRLPGELRNLIYELVLSDMAPSMIDTNHRRMRLPDQPLLQVNRTTYSESHQMFKAYTTTRTTVEVANFDFQDLIKFLTSASCISRDPGDKSLHIAIRVTDIRDGDEVQRNIHRWSRHVAEQGQLGARYPPPPRVTLHGFRVTYSVCLDGLDGQLQRLRGVWRVLGTYGRGLPAVDGILAAIEVAGRRCGELRAARLARPREEEASGAARVEPRRGGMGQQGMGGRALTYAQVVIRSGREAAREGFSRGWTHHCVAE
ncbi:hypothetical protein Tdes44962_MAKER08945 [Teratosphaeria destructans]|uniref:Uncharacterized protein n=1 Tax=Teratosphaeria destructans TaxID=418781 RepID=A0A9W7W3M5_9PEZI|nr:hypothetical protein Tdes44962_MAKER08945 [Teratosphaeria destructans]